MGALSTSFREVNANFRFARLFSEDPYVKGTGWFHKRREDDLHVFGNCFRILIILIFSPIYLLTPKVVADGISNFLKLSWLTVYASTPFAVLSRSPGDGTRANYQASQLRPRYMLEVTIKEGTWEKRQIEWSTNPNFFFTPYTAISYAMESAEVLYQENPRNPPLPPKPTDSRVRRYDLSMRQEIVEYLLELYLSKSIMQDPTDRVEYIWLDEYCLSHVANLNPQTQERERRQELGCLADVFRGAAEVIVFCHDLKCDHTTQRCAWGRRLFTLSEILFAKRACLMIRQPDHSVLFHRLEGNEFRRAIQVHAESEGLWHLDAIMRHSINAGSVPWQVAIHSLVVEAMLRDDFFVQSFDLNTPEKEGPPSPSKNGNGRAPNFKPHNLLGKALNGLLPRRARLVDLKGEDGWNDLAWLLELNQGFYNAASLAAVSRLSEDPSSDQCWLGRPIAPNVGNERLEPLVFAFPIARPSALNVISPKTIGLRESLQRDRNGLYSNEKMRGLKWLTWGVLFLLIVASGAVASQSFNGFIALLWLSCSLASFVHLMVGSMYLERSGWVLLDNAAWESLGPNSRQGTLSGWLGHRDGELRDLVCWGDDQLVPRWDAPRHGAKRVTLVDIGNNVYTDAVIRSDPIGNAIVPLAVHGSGITCMILNRPDFAKSDTLCHRVGMVNLPPYILAQATETGTWLVGSGVKN